jgi:hypothetical protein
MISITKISFPDSIEIDDRISSITGELSMNRNLPGTAIRRNGEHANAPNSICVKCDSDSNVTDEIDSQFEKHLDRRISAFLGIKIN